MEAAQTVYHTLHSLARTPQEIDFWQETDTRRAVAASLVTDAQLTPYWGLGYVALNHNDPVTAVAHFLDEIGAHPNQTTAYLGLGIAYMQIGNEALAAQALHRARALDAGHATVRLYGSQQPYINLWQAVLDDNEPDRVLTTVVEQSMLEYGNYSLTLFGRIDPPYDVTPQLHCFDRNPIIAAHLNWLYMLYKTQPTLSATETSTFELVDNLREGNGIQPCQAIIR
jgi:tetratricopeptide (TPR) repeat protein